VGAVLYVADLRVSATAGAGEKAIDGAVAYPEVR
jgi:hypothetical protein